jgi:simple sugar transport system substrate-binding protein
LKGAIKRVTDKRILLITTNQLLRARRKREAGAVMHIGQSEYSAGKAAGERGKAAGKKSFVCVNHFAAGNASWDPGTLQRPSTGPQ